MEIRRILRRDWTAIVFLLLLSASAVGQYNQGDSGQYQILQARYGTANHNVDVTEQLKDLARQDRSFRMGNSTFGIDPDHNVVKTLRIYTRGPGGTNRMFEYREGSTVDGSMFTGWGGGNWEQGGYNGGWDGGGGSHNGYNGGKSGENNRDAGVPNGPFNIINATYGAGKHTSDVTSRVRSLISNGRLNITVSNDSLGTDPAPGSHKTLWVTYSNGGRGQQHTQVNEGSRLNIP